MSGETIFVIVLVVALLGGYFFLMYFFPEWVGISGDKTKAIQKEQHLKTNPNSPAAPDDKKITIAPEPAPPKNSSATEDLKK